MVRIWAIAFLSILASGVCAAKPPLFKICGATMVAGKVSIGVGEPLLTIRNVSEAKLAEDGKSVGVCLTPEDTKQLAHLLREYSHDCVVVRANNGVMVAISVSTDAFNGCLAFHDPDEKAMVAYLRAQLHLSRRT